MYKEDKIQLSFEDYTILSFCISVFNAQAVYDEELVQKRIDELKAFIGEKNAS